MSGHSRSFPGAGAAPGQELSGVEFDAVDPSGAAALKVALPAAPPAARAGLLSVGAYELIKRTLDIAVSAAALLVLAPFLALFALIIKLQDGGSIFYVHDRVGKDGRHFKFYKFRSMVRDAEKLKAQLAALNEHADPRTFKMKRDPRITRFGRVMRKYSLDELPQLWNVLKGDMSLVGPRPPLPDEVALYTPEDHRRLEVKPGLTCFWQIGGRGDLEFADQVRLDVDYIERRCLLLDLEILFKTIPAVITGRGAY